MAPGYKRSTGGWQEHHLGTGVQAVQLSPYRAGLAEPALQRFGAVAALPTCYFPPGLSLRGGSVGPRTFSEFFPVGPGILCRVTRRTEGLAGAHLPHDGGATARAERQGRAPYGVRLCADGGGGGGGAAAAAGGGRWWTAGTEAGRTRRPSPRSRRGMCLRTLTGSFPSLLFLICRCVSLVRSAKRARPRWSMREPAGPRVVSEVTRLCLDVGDLAVAQVQGDYGSLEPLPVGLGLRRGLGEDLLLRGPALDQDALPVCL